MRQVKFNNKTVSVGKCKIGAVVSNTNETWFGHIIGFGDYKCLWVQWETVPGAVQERTMEEPEDLIIWE